MILTEKYNIEEYLDAYYYIINFIENFKQVIFILNEFKSINEKTPESFVKLYKENCKRHWEELTEMYNQIKQEIENLKNIKQQENEIILLKKKLLTIFREYKTYYEEVQKYNH